MTRLKRLAGLVMMAVLFTVSAFAQTIKGTVIDTTGKAITYATVSLKNGNNNTIITYTETDSKGSFILKVPANAAVYSLMVEVHSIGYKTAVKNIANFDAPLNFILAVAVNQLNTVVVKSFRPILRTHGDTLSYNVSDFADLQDRTIGEVIKKLPGISVAKDGTISYNNKPISAVYIGGDNLLDDKYSIATNSIPQTAVSQVQVIQNDQPVKILQNKVFTEDVALNLQIKKGARLHLMGQESIGAGQPGNYDVNLNGMMFKDNYKAINYLAGNNTGYDVQRDLVSHDLSDYNQRIDNALPSTVLSLGAVNTPQLAENRYLFDRSGVINVNNLVNLKKNVQLRINAYYVHDTQRQDYSQHTTVFLPADTVKYNETEHNRYIPDILHVKFMLNINRDKYYLNDALLLDHKAISNYSGLNADSSAVNQAFKDNTLNFSNEFNMIKSLKSNDIVQAYSYISRSAEPENLVIGPGYNAAIFNNNVPYAQLVQNVNIPSWYTNNYFSLKIPSNLITQSYRTGFSVQSQTLTSDLNVVQSNNTSNLESDSALNHVSWSRKKAYAEAAYDLPGDALKASLTLPFTLQQINYSDNFYALNKSLTKLYFNPQFRLKYQVGLENYLSIFYSYRNDIGNIENVYLGYILTDYRTLYANKAGLTEQQDQQVGGGFSYRKSLTLFFWSVSALYSHMAANNIASSVITNNLQQGIVLPYPNSNDSWTLNGSVSKYSFWLRTTFSGWVQWQSNHSLQIQNNALLPFNTTSETFNLSTDTKVASHVNFNYKATLTQTGSHSSVDVSTFRVGQQVQEATVNYDPIDDVEFKLSGEHYFTHRQGNPDLKYFFADASAKFRINKWKTDLELSAVNFLDVKTYNALYLSANTLTAGSYTLPGRIIMLRVVFNI